MNLLLIFIIGFQISSLNGVIFNPLKFLSSSTTSTQQQQQQQQPSGNSTTTTNSSSITNSFNPLISLGNRENTTTLFIDYGQQIAGVTINVLRQRSKRESDNKNNNNDDAFTILQNQYYKSQLQLYGQVQQQTVNQNKNVALYRLTQRIQALDGIKLSLTLQNNFYATRGINEIKQIESQLPSELNCDAVKNVLYESRINDGKNEFDACVNENLNDAKSALNKNRDSLTNVNNNLDKITEIISKCDESSSTTQQKTTCYTNAITTVKGNTIKLKISIDTILYTVESDIDDYQLEMSNCNLNINKIIAQCKVDLSTAIDNCV